MTATVTLLDGTSQTFNVTQEDVDRWLASGIVRHHVQSDEAYYIIPIASILGIVIEELDA